MNVLYQGWFLQTFIFICTGHSTYSMLLACLCRQLVAISSLMLNTNIFKYKWCTPPLQGMACVGRTKQCTIVPSNHYGPIPGIPVGSLWKFRVQVSPYSWRVQTCCWRNCINSTMGLWSFVPMASNNVSILWLSRSVNLVSTGHM